MTNKKGFTLIEIILYVSLTAILLLSVSAVLAMMLQSRIKNQVIAEVEQQGTQVMNVVTQTIRNSENISTPTQSNSASSLTLDVVNATNDPTVFDLSGGVLRITEGVASAIDLTSSRVIVSSLNFQNLSKTSTPGIVHIEFTITHGNPEGRNEYDYSKIFYGSASLR